MQLFSYPIFSQLAHIHLFRFPFEARGTAMLKKILVTPPERSRRGQWHQWKTELGVSWLLEMYVKSYVEKQLEIYHQVDQNCRYLINFDRRDRFTDVLWTNSDLRRRKTRRPLVRSRSPKTGALWISHSRRKRENKQHGQIIAGKNTFDFWSILVHFSLNLRFKKSALSEL